MNDSFIRYQIKVEHLVTVRTEDYEVADIVVGALTIDVRKFEHRGDTETAVSAEWIVCVECQFSVIDALCHCGCFREAQRKANRRGAHRRSVQRPKGARLSAMLELKRIVNAVSRWLDVKLGVLPGWGPTVVVCGMVALLQLGLGVWKVAINTGLLHQ